MAEVKTKPAASAAPPLETEYAHRLLDPFEQLFQGLVRTNDPLLLERGGPGSGAELYRDLRRDGKVFAALQKRKLALVGRPYQVTPVTPGARGDADAETLQAILKRSSYDRLCYQQMDALLAGTAVNEMVYTVREGLYQLARTPQRALRRFAFVQEEEQGPPALRLVTRANMITGQPLPERAFVVHRVNAEDDNPWGIGLGLQSYWAVWFKRKAVISWNKLCDRMGVPTPWGQYPRNAQKKEQDTLFDALKAMSNDGVVMTPEGTMIQLLESKIASGGISTQQGLVEYMDDWIDAVWLGRERSSKGGGALAAASKERADVALNIVQADADLLCETHNDSVIQWLCEVNGLAPCQVSRIIKEEEDLQQLATVVKTLTDAGFELDEAQIVEKFGEGWKKKAAAPAPVVVPGARLPAPGADNAAFAEGDAGEEAAGQKAIDAAIAAVSDAELRDALEGLFEPLLAAIEGADTFEEALAAAEQAFPKMKSEKLQALLARAMFGAEAFGRQEAAAT